MTAGMSQLSFQDIPFSDSEFQSLAQLARRDFGLNLAESKKPLVYSRLSRRLKARNLSSFGAYLALIAQHGEDEERHELISALTTNVTSFFREKHHFDLFRDACLPQAQARSKEGQRVRFWSAGCSSGQEPYSMAMAVLGAWPDAARQDVRILATDIDPRIVHKAKEGRYPVDDIDALPAEYRQQFGPAENDSVSMPPQLRELVTFAELNLMSQWPFRGPFDVIFCRNVAIYFDQETQQSLWNRFSDLLIPGGYLFIGHSERLSGPATEHFSPVGITSYQKHGGDSRQQSK